MLFHVQMDVRLPPEMDPKRAEGLKAIERARCQELMRSGKWRHLWQVAGRFSSVSVFDVESPAELHELLGTLPFFPYAEVSVAALCRHASSIREDDR